MPIFVDKIIKTGQDAYNKAWNAGKDPKNASTPQTPVKRKYSIVNSKDATKTVYGSDDLPDAVLASENKTSPIASVVNFGKNSQFSTINGSPKDGPSNPNSTLIDGIKGNNSQYTPENSVESFKFRPPKQGKQTFGKDKTGKQVLLKAEKGPDGEEISEGKLPYSSFNRYTLMKYRGTPLTGIQRGTSGAKYAEYNQIDAATIIEPTTTNIVQECSKHGALGYQYQYSDFAMCKYLGKIPNNYLITLRRFPFPVEDDIITPVAIEADGTVKKTQSPDIARAVTWMSEATGNALTEILALDYKYHWEESKADVQEVTSTNSGDSGGVLGRGLLSTSVGKAFMGAGQGIGNVKGVEAAGSGFDPLKGTYPNHVFGPYNKITSMLVRGKDGLLFDKEFTIKFQYEMKGLYGTNPKVLFMDQLANILALTYSTAPFWGGEVRYLGSGSIGKPFGNAALLQSGNYGGFLGSVFKDLQGMATNIVDDIKKNGLGGSNLAKNLIGGQLQDLFNSPQAPMVANALLTGDPTGQWHITIGNPLNPMMVMGNLCCTGTKVSFKGGNSVQDFPEEMEVEITLKPGRPRDKADIESMFNAGRGRFYLKPHDGVDINKTRDVSEYGEKSSQGVNLTNTGRPASVTDNAFRKFAAD
jgi:hypothetical protein